MSLIAHISLLLGKLVEPLDAFDLPDPRSFATGAEQLTWGRRELQAEPAAGHSSVLFVHCYPSDLKAGEDEAMDTLRTLDVRVIEIGRTHYNEIADDSRTFYFTTRATGHIEEGPVGYSFTNMDRDVVSWKFIELGNLLAMVITSPIDEPLLPTSNKSPQRSLTIWAKFWGEAAPVRTTTPLNGRHLPMVAGSQVWETRVDSPRHELSTLRVSVEDQRGKTATDEIRVLTGAPTNRERAPRDRDNALDAWPEHGLLGTQLGPHRYGKKW